MILDRYGLCQYFLKKFKIPVDILYPNGYTKIKQSNKEGIMIAIDSEKAIVYGTNGSVSYHINDTGGVEFDDFEGELTEAELTAARAELEG